MKYNRKDVALCYESLANAVIKQAIEDLYNPNTSLVDKAESGVFLLSPRLYDFAPCLVGMSNIEFLKLVEREKRIIERKENKNE